MPRNCAGLLRPWPYPVLILPSFTTRSHLAVSAIISVPKSAGPILGISALAAVKYACTSPQSTGIPPSAGRVRRDLAADGTFGASAVLDEVPAQTVAECRGDDAPEQVAEDVGPERNGDAHRFGRIVLLFCGCDQTRGKVPQSLSSVHQTCAFGIPSLKPAPRLLSQSQTPIVMGRASIRGCSHSSS